ncbi:hypothetical protein GOP47_0012282 [Adiantum capillus-veneris]|uniref:Uncharacterized protein n=1 Tax=Adiantum capillus-veneris TaxID=13818 RepID=A0A9D4ZGQ4_ADICA|nr:hypothetical protein GOP47_0012282 [Adiantum capillus-veneris]
MGGLLLLTPYVQELLHGPQLLGRCSKSSVFALAALAGPRPLSSQEQLGEQSSRMSNYGEQSYQRYGAAYGHRGVRGQGVVHPGGRGAGYGHRGNRGQGRCSLE